MPPLSGERFKPAPKTPEQEALEALVRTETEAVFALADATIPASDSLRKSRTVSTPRAVYEWGEGSGKYVRAWLVRRDERDTRQRPCIELHTDEVTRNGEGWATTPNKWGTFRAYIAHDGITAVGAGNLTLEQQLSLVNTVEQTVEIIAADCEANSIRYA